MLVVDSISGAITDATHTRYQASKLFAVVHAPMLLAGRGIFSQLGYHVSLMLNSGGPAVESFDLIYPQMPELIRLAHEGLLKQGRELGIDDRLLLGQEMVAVGWSASRQRIEGSVYQVNADGIVTTSLLDVPWFCGPGDASVGLVPPNNPPKLPELLRFAGRQVEYFTERWPTDPVCFGGPPCVGGRLVIAKILPPGRITIESHPL